MESVDKSNYIIIGKYWISKMIMMSCPPQLTVSNTETNITLMLRDYQVFELLRNEGLDTEPLHEYFDAINGTTKEDRMNTLKMFEEWEQKKKEKM